MQKHFKGPLERSILFYMLSFVIKLNTKEADEIGASVRCCKEATVRAQTCSSEQSSNQTVVE